MGRDVVLVVLRSLLMLLRSHNQARDHSVSLLHDIKNELRNISILKLKVYILKTFFSLTFLRSQAHH